MIKLSYIIVSKDFVEILVILERLLIFWRDRFIFVEIKYIKKYLYFVRFSNVLIILIILLIISIVLYLIRFLFVFFL